MFHVLRQDVAVILKNHRKIQCKGELCQKVMNIYKHLTKSCYTKAVLNKLSGAFYRLGLCAFILEFFL